MSLTDKIIETILAHPDWDSVQIGRALGCRDAYVRAAAARRGMSFGPKKILTEEQKAAIAGSDDDPKEIAKRYGISVNYARELLQPKRVPAHVLADRRRRQDARNHLDLTGQLMGDPPPRSVRQHGPAGREDSL